MTNLVRKIIHVDMDAFYASVEQRDHPEWKNKPLVVGGNAKRGVVASASYEARNFGIHSAMPSVIAKRRCPQLIFAPARFEIYKEISLQIRAIFFEYTDLVEPLSLDEAFLDVTRNKQGNPSATIIAAEIRKRIFSTTGLTASAGVSFNKFLAKIASDENKPNGMCVIRPVDSQSFIDKLPVKKFFGVGKVTADKMHRYGIRIGADLKKYSEQDLTKKFGKSGSYFFNIARGVDNRMVNPNRVRKSIGAERTFAEDLTDKNQMLEKLLDIGKRVYDHMEKSENFGRTITLKAKTPDFVQYTRSKTLGREISSLEEMNQVVMSLLDNNIEAFPEVRLLGVSVSGLLRDVPAQLEFDFEESD